MGYGQKVKKWFFDEDGDEVEEYEDVEIDTEPKTSLFEQAKFSKTSDAIKALNANKDSQLILSGVIFAIEGDIQRIGPRIFLCTPKNIGVSGTIDLDEDESEE